MNTEEGGSILNRVSYRTAELNWLGSFQHLHCANMLACFSAMT